MVKKNDLKLKLDIYEKILKQKRILPNVFTLDGIKNFSNDEVGQLYWFKYVIKTISPAIDDYLRLAVAEVKQYDETTTVEFIVAANRLRSKIIKIRDTAIIKNSDEKAALEEKKYFNLYIDSLESVLGVLN